MKFLAIIESTVREGLAKWTILGMFFVSTIAIVISIFVFQMDTVQHGLLAPGGAHVHRGANSPALDMVGVTVLDVVWMTVSLVLLFLSVFIGVFTTAGFITSMMEKGAIDLLLSKPVPRWMYVTGRYVGSVFIIFVEVVYLIFGLWLCAGLSLGVWSGTFLYSIPFITLTYAAVFGLVTFIGILTRSSWFAIIIGLAIFMFASAILPIAQLLDRLLNGESKEGVLTMIARVFHYTVPQANEVARTMTDALLKQPVNYVPILLTFALALVYLGLSSYAFSRKEF